MFAAQTPFRFTQQCAVLLSAAGFECEHVEAHWEDIGGPENGPKLSGHPAHDSYTLTTEDKFYEVIVCDGVVEDVHTWPIFDGMEA